jgi:V/A-type H+-transporting ATPase subunit E
MSLETVVEDIREQARARADEIREEAREEADQIREEAREEADQIERERLDEAQRQIEQEREQRLSSAKLEAKQERLSIRRDLIQRVREEVETAIAELEGEQRERLTRQLLEATLEEFDGHAEVYGRAEDQELLESLLADYDAEYAGSVDCLGGVVAESDESRVRVNNTFDSILESIWEENLRGMSERLFEQE